MVRRVGVVLLLSVSAVAAAAGAASAHVPFEGPQRGCVTENDIWAVPGSASWLLAPGASDNTCGNK